MRFTWNTSGARLTIRAVQKRMREADQPHFEFGSNAHRRTRQSAIQSIQRGKRLSLVSHCCISAQVIHTQAEKSNISKFLPNDWIMNLLRNSLCGTCRDQPDCEPKRYGMHNEFIHDHMDNHHDGEQYRKYNSDQSRVLWACLESENTEQERSRQQMHRQLVGWIHVVSWGTSIGQNPFR